jgi:hypothetical protein
MKQAFIPIILRPKVPGVTFSISDISYAEEVVNSISSIDEILNLCSRRRIIAKIIKNISGYSFDDINGPSTKIMKQIEFIFLKKYDQED